MKVDFKKLVFKLNESSNFYECTNRPDFFSKVPNKLKIEETRRPDIIKSNWVIVGRKIKGKYSFFSGLRKTKINNIYQGDYKDFKTAKKSLILFIFNNDNSQFDLYFFNNYNVYPEYLHNFIRKFLSSIK